MKQGFIKNKQIALLGIAKSTISTYEFLSQKGFLVYIWDDNLEVNEKHKNLNIVNFKDWNFKELDAIVISPGIPLYHPKKHNIVQYIEKFNVSILTDIELFYYFFPSFKYIGITGSNGKSSLVTLLFEVFKLAKKNVSLAGNIGIPIFSLKDLPKDSYIILELSSFQLSYFKDVKLNIAVLLNVSANHNKYHGGFNNYRDAKFNIFKNQTLNEYSIINLDQGYNSKLIKENILTGNIITGSSKGKSKADLYIKKGILYKNKNPVKSIVYDFNKIFNRSGNFLESVLFCYIIASLENIDINIFVKAISSFKGLEHRQEKIGTLNNIIFVNDSKATTAIAAKAALSNYSNIYWLVGGIKKSGSLNSCKSYYNKVKHVFIFGKDKEIFAKELENNLKYTCYGTLKEATTAAFRLSVSSKDKDTKEVITVLLSPVGVSFDEFNNFEERGKCFKSIIKDLINDHL